MDSLLQALAPLFVAPFSIWDTPVTRLEIVAFVLSLAMVVLNMRVNPWAWPLAIVASLLYWLLFWSYKLYGEGSLQIFFAVIGAWGWWQWLSGHQGDGRPLVVRALDRRGWLACGIAMALAWPGLGLFLDHMTDSDVPWLDAFPTALSLIGQWLLGRKYVENWPTWVVVNIASVGLFAYKGLWLTVVLYAIFIVLSFVGWRAWRALAAKGGLPA